jgi:iron complex outermembrane receptor protein
MSTRTIHTRRFFCLQTCILFLAFLGVSVACAQAIVLPTLHVNPDQTKSSHKPTRTLHLELTQKDIQNTASLNVVDLIQKQGLAHIQPGSGNPNQTMVSMDGFGNNASSNSVVLIDGVPITSFTNVGPNLNTIILDNIQSLTITPGSDGVLYGDQAVSGVLSIQTRQPEKPLFEGNFGLGNMGQVIAGIYGSDRVNPQSGYNVGLQTDYTHHDMAYNAQQNTTFNLNIHHDGPTNSTSANLISYIDHAQAPSESILNSLSVIGSPEAFDMSGTIGYVTNQHRIHDQDHVDTRFAVYQTHLGIAYLEHSAWELGDQIDQKGLFLSNQWHHTKQFLLGLDDQYNHYQHTESTPQDHAQANMISPYVRKQFQINSKLTSILGVRYANQYLQANGSNLNIQGFNQAWANEESLTEHLTSSFNITLRHDSSYAFATGKDVLWRSPLDVQTPLKTQMGDQYNLDFHLDQSNVSNLISLYEMNIQNELAIRFDGQSGMSEIYNLPSTRRLGVNVINQWHFNPQWFLNTQVSYVDPRLTSPGYNHNMIPAVSLWNGSMAIQYQTQRQWLASVEETVHSSFYAAFDLQNQGAQLPGYALTNVHLQKKTRSVTYDLSVNNIFDHHAISYANFSPSKGLIYYYPSDGVSIVLHLDFKLLQDSPSMSDRNDP